MLVGDIKGNMEKTTDETHPNPSASLVYHAIVYIYTHRFAYRFSSGVMMMRMMCYDNFHIAILNFTRQKYSNILYPPNIYHKKE